MAGLSAPRAATDRARPNWPVMSGTAGRPSGPPRRGATLLESRSGWRPTSAGRRSHERPPTTRARWNASSASPTGTRRAITWKSPERPGWAAAMCRADHGRDAGGGRGGVHARSTRHLRRPALRRDRAAGAAARVARRRARSRRWRRSTTRSCRPGSSDRAARSAIRIVGVREARRELTAALREGTSVGLVGDRDLTGGGTPDRAVRRSREPAARPRPARHRDRRAAVRHGACAARAPAATPVGSSASTSPARAPAANASPRRQHRSLARSSASSRTRRSSGGPCSSRSGRTSSEAARRAGDAEPTARDDSAAADRSAAAEPTCTSTRSRPTALADVVAIIDARRRGRGDLDVIAITDHERIDAARRRHGRSPATAACRSRSSSGRRSRRSAATCSALFVERRDPAVPHRSGDDRRRPRGRRHRHPGPPAGPLPAVRPGLGPPAPPGRPGRRRPARRARDLQPDGARAAVARSCRALRRRARPRAASATATRTRSRPSAAAGRRSRAGRQPTCGRAIEARTTDHGGSFHGTAGQFGVFGQQLRKRAARRARRASAVASDATARVATTAIPAAGLGRRATSGPRTSVG